MSKIPSWKKKQREAKTNRERILTALGKENLTFTELLNQRLMSRGTLATHLKTLRLENSIEKYYDSKKGEVTYRPTAKAKAELQIEGMIKYLGVVATHRIIRQLLNKSTPINLEQELNEYLKALKQAEPSFQKQLFDYLEKNHPLVI